MPSGCLAGRILGPEADLHRRELTLPPVGDREKGRRLLEEAEKTCLITNSLNVKVTLDFDVNAA